MDSIPQHFIYKKWKRPMDFYVMLALFDRYYASRKNAEKYHMADDEFYTYQGWLAEKMDRDISSINNSIANLIKMGYIDTPRKEKVNGEWRWFYRINFDKINQENIDFDLGEEESVEEETTEETNPTQSDTVAETNPTQSDSGLKKKMKDISITPYECSSKERVRIAAENTVEPKKEENNNNEMRICPLSQSKYI